MQGLCQRAAHQRVACSFKLRITRDIPNAGYPTVLTRVGIRESTMSAVILSVEAIA